MAQNRPPHPSENGATPISPSKIPAIFFQKTFPKPKKILKNEKVVSEKAEKTKSELQKVQENLEKEPKWASLKKIRQNFRQGISLGRLYANWYREVVSDADYTPTDIKADFRAVKRAR